MAYKFQLGAATMSGSLKQEGALECETSITIGSAALTEAELEMIDGITAGTAAASKAVVLDGSKNIATIGTIGCGAITSTGASSMGSLNVGGTLACDTSFTIDAVELDATELGFLNGATAGTGAQSKAVVLDGSGNFAGVNQLDTYTNRILNDDDEAVVKHASDGSRHGYSKWYEDGGVTETCKIMRTALSHSAAITAGGRLLCDDTTDATSTTDGSLQTDGGLSVVKDIIAGNDLKLLSDSSVLSMGLGSDATLTHDGTTGLTIAANPITLDSAGDLVLDMGAGQDIVLKNAGSQFGAFANANAGDLRIEVNTADKNLVLRGNDGGSMVNALSLDMANAGRATFNENVIINGNLTVAGASVEIQQGIVVTSSIGFEGSTNDGNEITLTSADPSTDRTITLPDLSGHVPLIAGAASNANVTAAEFALLDGGSSVGTTALAASDGFLHNDGGTMKHTSIEKIGDLLGGGAGLAVSSGVLSVDIDGLDALGGTGLHQTQDHFMFSDNGTEKKITFSNLQDAVFADVSGDATIAAGGALTIAAGAVENSMLADDAVGADELAANAVVNASIASNAAIDLDKLDGGSCASALTDLAQGDLMYAGDVDDSNNIKSITFSNLEDAIFGNVTGDASIAAGGALTIANDAVEQAMIADDAVGADQLASNAVVNASVADGTIKADKLDIDGSTDIGAALTGTDLFIVDDGAAGTNRKCTMARLKTFIGGGTTAVASKDDGDTLAVGVNYFGTHSGAESATLPASAGMSVGESVKVKAGSDCSVTNKLTINRAGSQTIDGVASIILESPYAAVELVYVAADTWRVF